MAEQKQSITRQETPFYLPADFYMVRAPSLPAQVFLQLSNSGHVSREADLEEALQKGRQVCAATLLHLATQPVVRQALALASPSLIEGLERVQRGEAKPARQERIYSGLLRYLVRMSTRPTPFGLFAGVGVGHFAEHTDLRLGEIAIAGTRTRPDMRWLLALLRQIETVPSLVSQLEVQLNQTAYLAGERVLLPVADTYGTQDTRAISLRATPVVRKIFALARQPLPYTELQAALRQAFPQASKEQVERALWQLWEHGFLISRLHPPLTDAQPATYVSRYLNTLQGLDETRSQLARVLESCSTLDSAGPGAPVSSISTLVQAQEKLVPGANREMLPLQVDSVLQLQEPLLNRSIGQAAARAATFLLRQTPLPTGPRRLQEYRRLFLDRYGEGAEVPLLDLLSPENGLDAPDGYDQPPRTYERPAPPPTPAASSRDRVLLHLVSGAVNQQRLEVELTEELQQQLERWSPQLEEAPLSLEIYLQVHAESREAIDRGEWTVVMGRACGSASAGRTFGRFFDLLGESGLEDLRDLTAREETLLPDVIFAELSYQPHQARLANVATRPPLRTFEIAVGTTPTVPPDRVIPLQDLVVGVQNERFYLRSLRLGKQVRVCQGHMLSHALAPNVCRFLTEIAQDGVPVLGFFDWGTLSDAPFLPRLVMKTGSAAKIVVTPACWQLQADTILPSGDGSEEARWFRGLRNFREQWRVPRYVYLADEDNRLLLDLENPLMALELRAELRKLKGQRQLVLDEVLPDFAHLWLRDAQNAGYFSEIVVPLLRAATPAFSQKFSEREKLCAPQRSVILPAERRRFPGEDWIYLKLYAALGQHEELLAGPLREVVSLMQERELIDRWFFIRYLDPEPHLRLRFHAKDATAIQPALALALSWSAQLARRGKIQHTSLETYEREVERYGGPAAIDLLEQVFTIDSSLVSDLVACQYARYLSLDALMVAVFTLDYFFSAWGWTFRQRLEWARQAGEKYAFSSEYHSERKRYCDLLFPGEQLDASLAEQRTLLLDLLRLYETGLGDLGARVRQLAEAGKLWISEMSLLDSLAHMHVNRLLGIDRTREDQVYAFWRHTLNSCARRPGQDAPGGREDSLA